MSDHDEYADVLLYSDDATTRQAVMGAIGRRAGKGLPLIRWDETATADAVVTKVESRPYALLVLDGEAAKVGGMAVCRQLKQEIYDCPPALVLTARPQDAWLATWSLADGYVAAPYDPRELQQAVASLLSGS
jgi:DNA-binding response OmpR family regulator